jgi:hypothetical protein
MTRGGRTLRHAACALLGITLLVPAAARAEDEGDFAIPSNGEDVVRLDDGRTLRCRVGAKEGTTLRLEFADGTLTVPAARVARVLRFRDFDSAPRDASEKEKAARGLVRWSGEWLTPVRVKELRDRHLAAERRALAEVRPTGGWSVVPAGKFKIHSQLSMIRTREFASLLQKYLQCLRTEIQLPLDDSTGEGSIPVHIYGDRKGFLAHAQKDGGVGEHTIGYFQPGRFSGQGHIVLYDLPEDPEETLDVLLHEATHLFLNSATGSTSAQNRPWINEGLAEYMGASTWKYGRFQPGALQEERLLRFQEMMEQGKVIPLERLVRLVPWDDPEGDELKGEFGLDHYAEAWCFVHFLFHGRQGFYRGAIRDYIKRRWETEGVAYLLSRLERKDFSVIEEQFLEYARGLKLTGGRAYARRALIRLGDEDRAGAEADLGRAVERAGRDGPTLVTAGRVARYLGKRVQAADLLRRALEEDPLDAGLRLERAFVLEGEEGEREARLATALAPQDAALRKRAERRLKGGDPDDGGDDGGAGETAGPPADPRFSPGDGPEAEAARVLAKAIREGRIADARAFLKTVPGAPNPVTAGIGSVIEGIEGGPAAMARALEAFRKSEQDRGPAGKGGGHPLSPGDSVGAAVVLATGIGVQAGKGALLAEGLDLFYTHEDPGTEMEWRCWAAMHLVNEDFDRARTIVDSGLRAFPRSFELKRLARMLADEGE